MTIPIVIIATIDLILLLGSVSQKRMELQTIKFLNKNNIERIRNQTSMFEDYYFPAGDNDPCENCYAEVHCMNCDCVNSCIDCDVEIY